MRHLLSLAATLAILSACERPADPAGAPEATSASAFTYAATADVSGYYKPVSPVIIGTWKLNHIFVSQGADFEGFTGVNETRFAPITLEFADETSPMVDTETGESRGNTPRVEPTRYVVSDDRIAFEGSQPELGAVRFEGRIDQGALATSRRNLGDEGVVVTGTLTLAGQTVNDVKLHWWMGD